MLWPTKWSNELVNMDPFYQLFDFLISPIDLASLVLIIKKNKDLVSFRR
jgi:hypothetical protein